MCINTYSYILIFISIYKSMVLVFLVLGCRNQWKVNKNHKYLNPALDTIKYTSL